jgi:hypothetical protein
VRWTFRHNGLDVRVRKFLLSFVFLVLRDRCPNYGDNGRLVYDGRSASGRVRLDVFVQSQRMNKLSGQRNDDNENNKKTKHNPHTDYGHHSALSKHLRYCHKNNLLYLTFGHSSQPNERLPMRRLKIGNLAAALFSRNIQPVTSLASVTQRQFFEKRPAKPDQSEGAPSNQSLPFPNNFLVLLSVHESIVYWRHRDYLHGDFPACA